MPAPHVVVKDSPADPTLVAATGKEGRFSLRFPPPGGYVMYLLGVHHEAFGELPLAAQGPFPVERYEKYAGEGFQIFGLSFRKRERAATVPFREEESEN
jgi:hypothetical protein